MTTDKQQALERLYTRQLVNFPLARDNFKALEQVVCKTFQEEGFRLRIQHNPARIISTNAKTDTASLQNRPCFLCPSGMPEAQKGRFSQLYGILQWTCQRSLCTGPLPFPTGIPPRNAFGSRSRSFLLTQSHPPKRHLYPCHPRRVLAGSLHSRIRFQGNINASL